MTCGAPFTFRAAGFQSSRVIFTMLSLAKPTNRDGDSTPDAWPAALAFCAPFAGALAISGVAVPAGAMPAANCAMASPCMASRRCPPAFAHLPYADPDAPKGGRIVLGAARDLRQPEPADRPRRRPGRRTALRAAEPHARARSTSRSRVYGLLAASRGNAGGPLARSSSISTLAPGSPTGTRSPPRMSGSPSSS